MQPEYKILNWLGPAGGGVNPTEWVSLQALAKTSNGQSPYLVANEIIASEIGRYLRLPVAPSCVVPRDGETYFMSLSFNLTGAPLPRVFPEEVVEFFPHYAAGIIAFDTLIANYDRHTGNIAAVTATKPQRLDLFDHDRCLLGHSPNGGIEHLKAVESRLAIVGIGNNHCLVPYVTDTGSFCEWFRRIKTIPDFFIVETCEDAKRYGALTDEECVAITGFLLKRRGEVNALLMDAQCAGVLSGLRGQLELMM